MLIYILYKPQLGHYFSWFSFVWFFLCLFILIYYSFFFCSRLYFGIPHFFSILSIILVSFVLCCIPGYRSASPWFPNELSSTRPRALTGKIVEKHKTFFGFSHKYYYHNMSNTRPILLCFFHFQISRQKRMEASFSSDPLPRVFDPLPPCLLGFFPWEI